MKTGIKRLKDYRRKLEKIYEGNDGQTAFLALSKLMEIENEIEQLEPPKEEEANIPEPLVQLIHLVMGCWYSRERYGKSSVEHITHDAKKAQLRREYLALMYRGCPQELADDVNEIIYELNERNAKSRAYCRENNLPVDDLVDLTYIENTQKANKNDIKNTKAASCKFWQGKQVLNGSTIDL